MGATSSPHSLSKSRYLLGLQCPKALYLDIHSPEHKDPVSVSTQATFDKGNEVGKLAQQLFQGGIEIPYGEGTLADQIGKTETEIKKGRNVIYEATFSHQGVLCKVDILVKENGGWNIYEVKSSTGMKDVYLDDVALQNYVLLNSALKVKKVHVVHVNNEYVRHGDIDLEELFIVNDVTTEAKARQSRVKKEIARLHAVLKGDLPAIPLGPHCSDPYECGFSGYCWKDIPEQSVFSLRQKGIDKFQLYRQGVITFEDLLCHKIVLNSKQSQQVQATVEKTDYVNKKALRHFLAQIRYPLFFLDFETFQSPIPPFDGTRPWQQIPFQYSLHYYEREGWELKHDEFLTNPNTDGREEIAKRLSALIPKKACVISYNSSFENGVLKRLGELFPKYKRELQAMVDNSVDLMAPFRSRDIYYWQMQGSYSLKEVLPALIPDLNYAHLEIQDGNMAMEAYSKMRTTASPTELERLRSALLAYCKMDTLATVRLLDEVRRLANS